MSLLGNSRLYDKAYSQPQNCQLFLDLTLARAIFVVYLANK